MLAAKKLEPDGPEIELNLWATLQLVLSHHRLPFLGEYECEHEEPPVQQRPIMDDDCEISGAKIGR